MVLMEKSGKDFNDVTNFIKSKPPDSVGSEKTELNAERDKSNETEALLPLRKGGLSKKSGKPLRKVQWNDKDGNDLAEILEFQPSDVSDSDDEDTDSCICAIM